MRRQQLLANAILWAAVIVAAAIVRAPGFFGLVLLPVLAATSILATGDTRRRPTH